MGPNQAFLGESSPSPFDPQTLKSYETSGDCCSVAISLGFSILRLLEHDSGVTTPASYSTFLKHCSDSVYMLCLSFIYDD